MVTVHKTEALEPQWAPNGWSWVVLRGFREGRRDALTTVYRLHADDVATFLRLGFGFESSGRPRRFVGYRSPFELQDALQETFRRAFEPRARESYDGIRPYGPYLRAIARNVVLRGFRRQTALFPELDADGNVIGGASPATPMDEPTPEQSVQREQVRALVGRFVATLSASDRELVRVRFVEGHSQRDAAAKLGIGRQRVRSREARVRARLLAYLRRHGEGELAGRGVVLPVLVIELALTLSEVAK